jgi:hypothetical protein
MNQVARVVRWALDRRHVGYAAALAVTLIGVVTGRGPLAIVAAVAFSVVAGVWAWEFQTKALRRQATDRERLVRVQAEVRRLANHLDHQKVVHEQLITATEQSRSAAERAAWSGSGRPTRSSGRPHVLFVTSNGSGMGHLTRLLAIARAGEDQFESSFVSLSTAAEVVTQFGFPCVRVASQGRTGLSWPEWNTRFARFMRAHLESVRPDAVVFDGIQVFRGVYESAHGAGIPLVWVARGLWKDSVPRDQVRRWRDIAELVLVPTERPLVADERALPIVDGGLVPVDPIVFLQPVERLGRSAAVRRLGLEPGNRHVLIQLGSGALASRAELEKSAVEAVRALGSTWVPVLFRSPLAQGSEDPPAGTRVVHEYPMVAFTSAFDFSVTSAGYNTVHENLRYAQPAIYVPDRNMLADDQELRAASVAEAGAGIVAESAADLAHAVESLSREEPRLTMARRAAEIGVADGAVPSAQAISEVIRTDRTSVDLACDVYEPTRTEGK